MNTPRMETSTSANAANVRNHFALHSVEWGNRYGAAPRSMADLDLALRRESVHRLLWPILNEACEKLRVIDVGCGTGDVLDGLPRDLMQVAGVDFVREMVQVARQTHAADRFLTADAAALPFRDECADVVTSLGMLEYLTDPIAAISSIHRILKPDGVLIVSFPNRRSLFRKLLTVERWGERLVHRLKSSNTNPAVEPMQASRYSHSQWSDREVSRMLMAAGFDVESVHMLTVGPWGRLGRWKRILQMSRTASRLLMNNRVLASWLASTMVYRAKKRSNKHDGRRD